MAKKVREAVTQPQGERLDDRPTAQRILDSAADVFYRKGFANSSVQEIADAVGILKGSLYYYIDSKDDLLARLIETLQLENLALIDEVAGRHDLEPLERLRLYVERQALFNIRNIPRITLYYRDLDLLPEVRRKSIVDGRVRFERFVSSLVSEAIAAGQVPEDADVAALTYCTYATTNFVYTWYAPRRGAKPEEMAAAFAEFVVAGVVGRRSASESPTA